MVYLLVEKVAFALTVGLLLWPLWADAVPLYHPRGVAEMAYEMGGAEVEAAAEQGGPVVQPGCALCEGQALVEVEPAWTLTTNHDGLTVDLRGPTSGLSYGELTDLHRAIGAYLLGGPAL
jgi:hypothetical protein